MPLTMNDLTIGPANVNMDTLLDDWSWAIPEPLQPVLLTAMGDAFAQATSGSVYFIDTVEGSVSLVTDNGSEFETLLTDTQFVTRYLFPSRIVQLREAGKTLSQQQVYSHTKPLVLGGDDNAENVEATDVSVHVSIHGQIHRQVKDLPEGASVDNIVIE